MLALSLAPNVGPATFHRLLEAFGSAEAVFTASAADLTAACPGLKAATLEAVLKGPDMKAIRFQEEACAPLGARIVSWRSETYPDPLLSLSHPPPFLFVAGEWRPEDRRAVAVVGTRHPSAYGTRMAREMTLGLAEEGFVIVSGMARGIDTLAHDAAIKAGARTLAVLGAGLDWIYPPENASLAKSIARQGALITEFPMGKAPHATHFPRRNRLISALSLGVLVVEAGNDSGALITADYALDQGREVFAIPGAVQHPGSRGTHKLIREGAHLVERAADIVAVLEGMTQAVPMRRFASPERTRIIASGPGHAGWKGLSTSARQASLPLSREPAATGATPEARPGQGDAGAAVVPSDIHPDSVSGEPSGSLDEESRALLSFLDRQGRTLEVIAEKARGRPGWTEAKPQRLLSGLLALELKGRVRRMPGALFRLR